MGRDTKCVKVGNWNLIPGTPECDSQATSWGRLTYHILRRTMPR
jgi:hypothetical protein